MGLNGLQYRKRNDYFVKSIRPAEYTRQNDVGQTTTPVCDNVDVYLYVVALGIALLAVHRVGKKN